MFYIINNNQIQLTDDNLEKLTSTLEFMPQYANSEIKETDICTAQEYQATPTKWVVQDDELIENPNWAEIEAEKQAERIARLKMTKLDFFKYVVAPTGTSYAQLLEAVGSNDLLRATWDLCNHVYRGDSVLNTYVTELLGVTPEQLDEVFVEWGQG